ncbi:hypothetical protein FQN54_005909 [Arachnomyces sp. PD_36]|nr:hypothetical protein FQN54_005909 [Arachnomyces sp. PD_36]
MENLCTLCTKKFESRDALDEHRKMRLNLKCNRCNRQFVNNCALEGHLTKSHTALQIRAPDGPQVSNTGNTLGAGKDANPSSSVQHDAKASNNGAGNAEVTAPSDENQKPNTSGKGREVFDYWSLQPENPNAALSTVDLEKRERLRRIACPVCDKPEDTLTTLRLHQVMNRHAFCDKCKSFFTDNISWQEHYRTVHAFICKECVKHYSSYHRLRQHQVETGHCYCKECKAFFDDRGDLERHSDKVHVYPCSVCPALFRGSEELLRHQCSLGHNFPCMPCGKKYGSFYELNKHQEEMHFPCKCIQCAFGFDTPHKLFDHEKPAKNLYCISCAKRFATVEVMDAHNNMIHKSVTCEYCGRHFISERAVGVHREGFPDCATRDCMERGSSKVYGRG